MRSIERNISVPPEAQKRLVEKAHRYSQNVARIVTKKDYTKPESALAVAGDDVYQSDVLKKIEHLRGAGNIILIGIGGSSLGTEAVYEALAMHTHPRLLVLDGIDAEGRNTLENFIRDIGSQNEFTMIVVSKSGTTTETLTNAVMALEVCEEKFGKHIHERVVFVGTEDTDFFKIGTKKKVITVAFPPSIGGRYSVFTAVGMVPLTLLGIDVISLREGAVAALSKENRSQIVEHAVSLVGLAMGGVHTVNFFTFNKRLRLLGFWYRQLLAESIGKRMTTDGTTFAHQLLPTVATDVDLHSMVQLYLGGYTGMYTHFVYGDVESEHHILSDSYLLKHVPMLVGHTPVEINNAIRDGVLKAYDDQKLPYRFTELPKISAYEIGFVLSSLMFEVMCIGDLFDVDAFTQPSVELYKQHARELLES